MADARLARSELSLARWTAPEWHRLWLALRARPWVTLAVVPGGRGTAPELTLSAAVLLSRTGAAHLRSPIHVADATGITLSTLGTLTQELEQCKHTGAPVLIALSNVADNPAALSIGQQCDAALLCIVRGDTRLAEIKATTSDVGQSRFIGSVVFRADDK